MRLLLAEDEIAMSDALVDILNYHKYTVDAVYNGRDALDYAHNQTYDGIILDIMMPEMDGLSVLRELRKEGNSTPVLILTAKSEVADRVEGLDAGADDYLPKPFAMDELLARLRALLRRREVFVPAILQLGNTELDQNKYCLRVGEKVMQLSNLEYRIIELFMRNPGMTFSADALLERVWNCDSTAEAGTVWVYISYLRKKLSALNSSIEIRSKRGLGYSLEIQS